MSVFTRAYSLPSRNAGFVDQGYDWKTLGMASKFYGERACAVEIRAAEVPMDYEAKARKVDFNVRAHGPLSPVLALLRSMPPTIGLVVGYGGGSRAASNSSCLTALRTDRSARSASGAAMGRTRPEV